MTDLEVAIQEVLQDKIAIDYEASGLIAPEEVESRHSCSRRACSP